MPLDALCLTPLADEIRRFAVGAKIDKVQQPGKSEIILTLRGAGESRKLLLSAAGSGARVHFTAMSYENPQTPPMFCMLMRKYLVGAKICAVRQPELERVLSFELDTRDEMGVGAKRYLTAELIGIQANLILTDADGIITDCLRRIEGDIEKGKRALLPGLLYRPPRAAEKRSPLKETAEGFAREFSAFPEKKLSDILLDAFAGLSPLIAREAAFFASGDTDGRAAEGREREYGERTALFFAPAARGGFVPLMLTDPDGKPKDYHVLPIRQYGASYTVKEYESMSGLLDAFYTRRDREAAVRAKAQSMHKALKTSRDRLVRRLAAQREELKATEGRERKREIGDIITANLYRMEKGASRLVAEDFYDSENRETEISLDPRLSPQRNAAKYYKEYNKAKTAERVLTELITKGEKELEYLESVLEETERAAGEKDVAEIRQELESQGYLKKSGKKEKPVRSQPLRTESEAGMEIRIGKNNVQNDELTFKTSFKTDLWFHAQKIHGSHVIVSTDGFTADAGTIARAAQLAAYYSQGKDSGKVAVDYTLVKFVKKPAGARPGMVTYTEQKTIIAEPKGIE